MVPAPSQVWDHRTVPTDLTRIHAVFDLAMRIGEGLLSNGSAASDVTATVLRVTSSSGLRNVAVQVTFDEVSLSYIPQDGGAPFTRIRATGPRALNFTKLEKYEAITHKYIAGTMDLEEATAAAQAVAQEKLHNNLAVVMLGYFLLGGSAALGLGAGLLVTTAAALSGAILIFMVDRIERARIPMFFAQILGGFFGVFVAIIVSLIDPATNASIVVVACIIVLLAGLTSASAVQDAVTGWYVTASARILETLMLTVGIVVGVRGGLMVAGMLGQDIAVSAALPVSLTSVLVLAVSGGVTGLGFAIGQQAPDRLLIWVAGLAAFSATTAHLLGGVLTDRAWSVGIAAAFVGMLSVWIARHVETPTPVLVMAGSLPLVPGSRIYRGLLYLRDDIAAGSGELLSAAEIAIAIAAGAVFGQLLASRLTRPATWRASSFSPVVATPFTTLRRRRMSLAPRRRALRRGNVAMEPSTMTSEMTALSSADLAELEEVERQLSTSPEEKP